MLGRIGLNDGLAPASAAAAPADLRDQREASFRGAKVRNVEAEVGGNDRGQRHRRVIKPLGDHLRADQNVALGLERREDSRVIADARRRVGIHAQHARLRERGALTSSCNALRPDAELADRSRAAGRAARGIGT